MFSFSCKDSFSSNTFKHYGVKFPLKQRINTKTGEREAACTVCSISTLYACLRPVRVYISQDREGGGEGHTTIMTSILPYCTTLHYAALHCTALHNRMTGARALTLIKIWGMFFEKVVKWNSIGKEKELYHFSKLWSRKRGRKRRQPSKKKKAPLLLRCG